MASGSGAWSGPAHEDWIGLSDADWSEWSDRKDKLDEAWDWFSGKKLEERVSGAPAKDGQQQPFKWPLKLNFVGGAARLHVGALFGEVADNSDPLVRTVFEPQDAESKADKEIAEEAERIFSNVLYENNGRSLLYDMALQSKPLGGMFIKASLETDSIKRPSGIRLEYVDPRCVMAFWSGSNYYDFDNIYIIYYVSKATALAWGVAIDGDSGLFCEYWDREKLWVKIDGKVARDTRGPLDRTHPYGLVPMVYVARERLGDLWGTSMVTDEVIGLTEEVNSRTADLGDSIHLGVHNMLVGKNLRNGYPQVKTIKGGQPLLDTGRAVSSGDPEPDVKRLEAPSVPTDGLNFVKLLVEMVRIAMSTPEIAYGKEEGTQRSGQTLFSRMWPLLARITGERILFSEAMIALAEICMRMLFTTGQELPGKVSKVEKKHLGLRKHCRWASMVPVDRQQLVQELIDRWREKAITPELLVERLGDAANAKEEVEGIMSLIKTLAEIEAKAKAAAAPKPAAPAGAKGASASSAGG